MDKQKSYSVYLHTIPKEITGYPNDMYYVGMTQDVNHRWYPSGYTNRFKEDIDRFGWENVKHEVLEECSTKEESQEREKYYIEKYDSINPLHGYNISTGGEGRCGVPCVRRVDLTGKRFGMLTVLYRITTTDDGYTLWKCKCDCGGTSEVITSNLQKGNSTSCGCQKYRGLNEFVSSRKRNLVGLRFGMLVAEAKTEYIKKDGRTEPAYRCRCDCGNEKTVLSYNLLNGHTTSCGCKRFGRARKAAESTPVIM